jgi:soluble lytic murein transglycosylase-like protein
MGCTLGRVHVIPRILQTSVFRPQLVEAAAAARIEARAAAFERVLADTSPPGRAGRTGEARRAGWSESRAEVLDPWLRNPVKRALAGAIEDASRSAQVDPHLAVAVAVAESSLDPKAQSSDGLSEGTFQVTEATEAEIRRKLASGRLDRPAGHDDVALGVAYLDYLDQIFTESTPLGRGLATQPIADATERRRFAVAAFNAGEGRVAIAQRRAAAAGGDPTSFEDIRPHLPTITRGYVDRVIRYSGEASPTA